MARGVNKVILIGNLGAPPEIRQGPNGVKVAKLRIATTESWRDRQSGESQSRTEWHSIVCFSGLAEIAEKYLSKGSKVYIEGSLRTSSWDAPDGQKRYRTEVSAREMTMLDSRRDSVGAPADSSYGPSNSQSQQYDPGLDVPQQMDSDPVASQQMGSDLTPPMPTDSELDDDIPF